MTAPGLDLFVQEITALRDTAFDNVVAAHERGDIDARAVAGTDWMAHSRTLSVLYRCTAGVYGTPIEEQPSPYQVINRAVADRQAVTR